MVRSAGQIPNELNTDHTHLKSSIIDDETREPAEFEVEAVEQVVLSRTVTLTDAQIKALHTGDGIEIVPDPGAGILVDFIRIFLVSHITAAYTNVGATSYIDFLLGPEGVDIGAYVNNNAVLDNGMLGDLFGADNVIAVSPGLDATEATSGTTQPTGGFALEDISGALKIHLNNAGALTGGDAANTLKVTVLYTVVDLT